MNCIECGRVVLGRDPDSPEGKNPICAFCDEKRSQPMTKEHEEKILLSIEVLKGYHESSCTTDWNGSCGCCRLLRHIEAKDKEIEGWQSKYDELTGRYMKEFKKADKAQADLSELKRIVEPIKAICMGMEMWAVEEIINNIKEELSK